MTRELLTVTAVMSLMVPEGCVVEREELVLPDGTWMGWELRLFEQGDQIMNYLRLEDLEVEIVDHGVIGLDLA